MKKSLLLLLAAIFLFTACNLDGGTPDNGNDSDGPFWCSFTVEEQGSIMIDQVEITGPFTVDRIEITERSTTQILGACVFTSSDSASTGVITPGYEFTAVRSPRSASGSTEIVVSSAQANLPIIHAYLKTADGLPAWEVYNITATGGLHGSGGAVYTDPYTHKEFEFAGIKILTFTTKTNKPIEFFTEHAKMPLEDAGYSVDFKSYAGGSTGATYVLDVNETLEARALIEEDVVLKQWKIIEVNGNAGKYEYRGGYTGTAKGSMIMPGFPDAKVWEITSEFTFEIDDALSTADITVYTTTEGTITQTCYTVPNTIPGFLWGDPASFTDTYSIAKGDGHLMVYTTTDPVQYKVSASISASTPLTDKPYTMYMTGMPPSEEVLETGAQEHMWLYSGDAKQTAESDGTLRGTYTWQYGANSYEWTITPDSD